MVYYKATGDRDTLVQAVCSPTVTKFNLKGRWFGGMHTAQTTRKDGKDRLHFSGVNALCSIIALEKSNSLLSLSDLFSLTVNHAHAIPSTTQAFISWITGGRAQLLMSNYFTPGEICYKNNGTVLGLKETYGTLRSSYTWLSTLRKTGSLVTE